MHSIIPKENWGNASAAKHVSRNVGGGGGGGGGKTTEQKYLTWTIKKVGVSCTRAVSGTENVSLSLIVGRGGLLTNLIVCNSIF